MDSGHAKISSSADAFLWKKPDLMVMHATVRASEATLELSLKSLNHQATNLEKWVEGLGASGVKKSPALFDDLSALTGVEKSMAMVHSKRRSASESRNVLKGLTATWKIDELDNDQILVLIDQIRFEVSQEKEETPEQAQQYDWQNPQKMMEQIQASVTENYDFATKEDISFFFISRINEEELSRLKREAFEKATSNCRQMAEAASRSLGALDSMSETGYSMQHNRLRRNKDVYSDNEKVLDSGYEFSVTDIVSENPKPVEHEFNLQVTYRLEP